MEQLSRGDGLGLNLLPNGDIVNENGDFIKKDGVYLDSPPFNNEIIPMEGIDQSFYNGSFITEEEAADEVFIKSMETQFKSEPEVDDFDVSGNKEPTLGENIAEFGSKLKDKLNENEAFVDNIKKDTAIGVIQGADAGLKNTLYAPGDIIGAGVDFVNDKIVKPVLNEFGIEGSDTPFGGTEMNTEAMDNIIGFINDITPNFLKEPINEFADQPFTFETYGNLVKGFSQFGIVAIPAAQIVGYMSSANSLVRAVAWSGISDFTAMNPDDPAIAKVLLDYFEVNQDKLEPWATNAIAVLEKHDTDGVITKRLKNFQEGVIVGAFADTVLPLIRGVLKASVNIPWKGLTPLIAGTAVTTNSNDAEASLFGAAVKAAAKEVVPNAIAKNADNVMQVDSLKQSNNQAGKDFDAANARYFEDGNYQAPTAENPISIVKPTETKPGIIAFHGSGADFNEFKLSKIGTGEGNQAFGYGLYFTNSKDIAKFYKDTVTYQNQVRKRLNLEYKGEKFVDLGDTAAAENASSEYRVITKLKEDIASYLPANPKLATVQEAKNRLLKRLDVEIDKYSKAGQKDSDLGTIELADGSKLEDLILESLQNEKDTLLKININDIKIVSGKTYEVNIKTVTDDLLDNDLPLNQQSKSIQEKINSLNLDFIKTDMTGDDIYDFIAVKKFKLGDNLLDRTYQKYDDKSVSELLNSVGIKGLTFKAGQLTPGQDTSSATNYVIFDDKIIDVMKKYGIVGAVGVTVANSNEAESNT